MKLIDFITSSLGVRTLKEEDNFIVEMANFLADVTELPANIVLWTKPQPTALPHDKYRIKVYKDRIHSATFSIGQQPQILWEVIKNKLKLDADETYEVEQVISEFASLFISYVDGKLTERQVKEEIKKIKNM